MVDYNRLKDHGRRIAWEFTFRPLYLSTDVHTYGLHLQGKNPIEDDNHVLTSCPLYTPQSETNFIFALKMLSTMLSDRIIYPTN